MSESKLPNKEPREKSATELKQLADGWEQTLDAIEQELEQKNESESDEEK